MVGTLHREYNRKRERVTEVKREVQALRKAAEKNAPLDHYQEIFEQYPDNLNELLSRIANNRVRLQLFDLRSRIDVYMIGRNGTFSWRSGNHSRIRKEAT